MATKRTKAKAADEPPPQEKPATSTSAPIGDDDAEYRLKRLSIVNLGVVQSFDYELPEFGVFTIAGINEAGKSTIFTHAMRIAINKAKDANKQLIRKTEDMARLKFDFSGTGGGFDIFKTIERDAGDTLQLRVGGELQKGRAFLDEVIGDRESLDPTEWLLLPMPQKIDSLLKAAGLADQLKAITARYEVIERERQEQFSSLRNAEGVLEQYHDVPHDATTELLPVDAFAQERKALDLQQKLHDDQKQVVADIKRLVAEDESSISTAEGVIRSKEAEIERLQKEIKKKKDEVKALDQTRTGHMDQLALANSKLASLPPATFADLDASVARIDAHNAAARRAQERNTARAIFDERKEAREAFTAQLKDLLQAKRDLCASARFPVEGLAYDGEVMSYQGHPLSVMSTGQGIRFATELAMWFSPILKIIHIEHGAEIDAEKERIIDELAIERRYQVLVERVYKTVDEALASDADLVIDGGRIVGGKKA